MLVNLPQNWIKSPMENHQLWTDEDPRIACHVALPVGHLNVPKAYKKQKQNDGVEIMPNLDTMKSFSECCLSYMFYVFIILYY